MKTQTWQLTSQEEITIRGQRLDRAAAIRRAAIVSADLALAAAIDARAESAWAAVMDSLKNCR